MSNPEAELAARILHLIDLTSLTGEEDEGTIRRLCELAVTSKGSVAAVCVYPQWVELSRQLLPDKVKVATVVNFPDPGNDENEIAAAAEAAISAGADEIDLVFPWRQWLDGDRISGSRVVQATKNACGDRRLKVIIESGELSSQKTVKAITEAAIDYGADFVKTSTGKCKTGATLEAAKTILTVIVDRSTAVGFKASGGVRTIEGAAAYLALADEILDPKWVTPATFRFGASGLLDRALQALGQDEETPTS